MTGLSPIPEFFAGRWWVVVLRGIAALTFGLLAFALPQVTFATLVLLFGFYALIYGCFSLIAAITNRQSGSRWLLALEGAVGVWAGIITLRTPSTAAMVLIFFVWVWAIATGILRIAEAFYLRKAMSGEVWLALSGVVTLLFGVMIMLRPVVGAVGLTAITAGFALLLGLFEILLGFELRAGSRVPLAA
jgi:uncharacterized membrane protein HdeD (DUF308 family)